MKKFHILLETDRSDRLYGNKRKPVITDIADFDMKCIVLFSKAPVSGRVKTRLVPPLSDDDAASLQHAFIFDTLSILFDAGNYQVFIACHPSREDPFFAGIASRYNVKLVDQGGGSLGDRMKRVLLQLKSKGYSSVVIVGSDSPTLPSGFISDAFEGLKKNDLVIGPSIDGGYYLIGVRGDVPDIFEGISWGSSTVFEETAKKVRAQAIRTHLLPFWYDIDTIDELRFVAIHLASLPGNQSVFARNALESLKEKISVRV